MNADVHFRTPPDQPALEYIQCSVVTRDRTDHLVGWRIRRYSRKGRDPRRCQHNSVVVIDGQHYCSRHGGMEALKLLYQHTVGPAL